MKFRSTLFAELRGSMAGTTASRNKGGNYLRARATPTNPNSEAQQRSRQAFADAVQAWDALTNDQRSAWAGYAAETPVIDKLGQEIHHSGRAWYIAQHAFFVNCLQTPVSNAPLVPGLNALGEPDSVVLSAADGLSANFSDASYSGGGTFTLAQIGPAIAAGVTAFKGPYTLLSRTGSNNFDEEGTEANRYGLPILNQRRPLRFRGIGADGRLSNVFETIVTVTA